MCRLSFGCMFPDEWDGRCFHLLALMLTTGGKINKLKHMIPFKRMHCWLKGKVTTVESSRNTLPRKAQTKELAKNTLARKFLCILIENLSPIQSTIINIFRRKTNNSCCKGDKVNIHTSLHYMYAYTRDTVSWPCLVFNTVVDSFS